MQQQQLLSLTHVPIVPPTSPRRELYKVVMTTVRAVCGCFGILAHLWSALLYGRVPCQYLLA